MSTPRRRFRLSTMETLGFIDKPGPDPVWSTNPSSPAFVDVSDTGTIRTGRHEADPFDTWDPSDVGPRLLSTNIRWRFISGILMIAVGLAGLLLWLVQRPAQLAEQAIAGVEAQAEALQPTLAELATLNETLTVGQIDSGASAPVLVEAETMAREMFEASGALPSAATSERAAAMNASTETIDAVGLIRDSFAYSAAVSQLLVPPILETDPELIALDEAAVDFGQWRSGFDSMRDSLPEGILPEVSVELALVSNEFDSLQRAYLDGLRTSDTAAVTGVIEDVNGLLAGVETLLASELAEVEARVSEMLASAGAAIDSLLG